MPAFEHRVLSELPPLGWLFQHDAKSGDELICGSSVKIQDDGFFEGCWPATSDGDVTTSSEIFGSGMQLINGSWLFLTTTHLLEALFLYRHSRGWSVSNSFTFLIASHGLEISWDARLVAKFTTICYGLEDYEKRLVRFADGEIIRIAGHNLKIESDGKYHLVRKPLPPEFPTFQAYINHLRQILRQSLAHATQGGYQPLTTISSGYDSTCVSVLAAELGCREAITLKKSRRGGDDSGTQVAEVLGLSVREFERLESVTDSFDRVAEFLVTGTGGEDFCFGNFAPALPRRVLFTGFRGDKFWDTRNRPNSVFGDGSMSGCSLQEFRLWQDFIHIPVPTIAGRRQPELIMISNSKEMAPWRLNNNYDRPISRRLAEEAGVQRHLFGQKKQAASVLFFSEPELFSPSVKKEYDALVPNAWIQASQSRFNLLRWHWRRFRSRKLKFVGRRLPAGQIRNRWMPHRIVVEHSHPRAVLEFLAALKMVGRRYRRALGKPSESDSTPGQP